MTDVVLHLNHVPDHGFEDEVSYGIYLRNVLRTKFFYLFF